MSRLLWPGLMSLLMLGVLIALGTWQVHRLAWKEAILARIAQAESAPAAPLPPNPAPFERVRIAGRLRADLSARYGVEVRDTPEGPRMGTQMIQPLERDGAAPVLVDRGWVPDGWQAPDPPAGKVTVEGYVHPPEKPGLFSPNNNAAVRRFFTLDPAAIGAALGLPRVAPFTLIAMGPPPSSLYPAPTQHLPQPPNNHLTYALTWYGLALALAAVFVSWSWKALRR